ncbi:hypothetical protein T265_14161, partial [Opisthorchis viverrini]
LLSVSDRTDKNRNNERTPVTSFKCLTALPPEQCTRTEILSGGPSLDSRDAEVGFEPRTSRSLVMSQQAASRDTFAEGQTFEKSPWPAQEGRIRYRDHTVWFSRVGHETHRQRGPPSADNY